MIFSIADVTGSSPAAISLLKVNNENTRTMCKICSNLSVKTPEQCHWRRSCVFNENFEQISHIILVFHLLKFEQVNAG